MQATQWGGTVVLAHGAWIVLGQSRVCITWRPLPCLSFYLSSTNFRKISGINITKLCMHMLKSVVLSELTCVFWNCSVNCLWRYIYFLIRVCCTEREGCWKSTFPFSHGHQWSNLLWSPSFMQHEVTVVSAYSNSVLLRNQSLKLSKGFPLSLQPQNEWKLPAVFFYSSFLSVL